MTKNIIERGIVFVALILLACQRDAECLLVENPSNHFTYEDLMGASAIWSYDQNILFCGNKDDLISVYKVTQLGTIIWNKYFDFGVNTYSGGLIETSDHEIFVCGGASRMSTSEKSDLLLIKLTSLGDTIWSNKYLTEISTGGQSILLTNDQHLLISGISNVFEVDSIRNIVICKIDLQGNLIWSKTFRTNSYERVSGLMETLNGEFIATGSSGLAGEFNELLLIRFDKNGDLLWRQKVGPQVKHGTSTIELPNGDLITCGNYNNVNGSSEQFSHLLVVKTDKNGSVLWERENGGADFGEYGHCIKVGQDDSFTISGYVLGASASGTNPLLMKIDANGKMLWCEVNTELKNGRGGNLLKDIDDNNVVIGSSNGDTFMSIIDDH